MKNHRIITGNIEITQPSLLVLLLYTGSLSYYHDLLGPLNRREPLFMLLFSYYDKPKCVL